jgi:hypothetical protein
MTCNCNNAIEDNNTIQFVAGTSVNLTFEFDEDISSYTSAQFVIRTNYETAPVINKTIAITETNTLNVVLSPQETSNFTSFTNGKNSTTYIWGLDVIDNTIDAIVNVFPQTGIPAPLCIVYKHVVED